MLKSLAPLTNLPGAFRGTASAHAGRPALLQDGREMSYGELDARSDVLAARLAAAGAVPGGLVGLAARQDIDTIIALVAIVKAGAGYVPLPDYYPADRLRHIRQEAGLGLVVGHLPALGDSGLCVIDPAGAEGAEDAPRTRPVLPAPDGEAVAYVMYTSGSTGTPKGVVVPHRAILRLVVDQDFMRLGPGERILQNSPIAFDAATLEIWGALLNGGTLVLPAPGETASLRGLGARIARERITTLWLTAGLFHAMADERPGDFAP